MLYKEIIIKKTAQVFMLSMFKARTFCRKTRL